jgi:hypothetical protein
MHKRYSLLPILLLLLVSTARAQDTPAPTKTSKLLAHFDFGLSGIALLTKSTTGTPPVSASGTPTPFTQSASTAAGAVVSLRGSKSPYKGLEFNYGYGRITESYTCCNQDVNTGAYVGPFQSQVTANEITFGYLVKPAHTFFGAQPYASVGAGTMVFAPTRNGGQGLKKQARAAYYYSVGVDKPIIGDTFGIRAGVRQVFYLGPDFDQAYLRIVKHTFTTEPQFGVYVHF